MAEGDDISRNDVSHDRESRIWREYDHLAQLERESTQMRYTTFTAFLSISFLIAGLGAQNSKDSPRVHIPFFGHRTISSLAFILGFLFFCFSWFFYWWYHRYSHIYRAQLKKLEEELGISVYRLRERKKLGRAKFHFDWGLRILGIWYFVVAGSYAGYWLLSAVIVVSLCVYGLFLLLSIRHPNEPNEMESH